MTKEVITAQVGEVGRPEHLFREVDIWEYFTQDISRWGGVVRSIRTFATEAEARAHYAAQAQSSMRPVVFVHIHIPAEVPQ